jgi:ABC-type uncharacterized transport system ATPase subunit
MVGSVVNCARRPLVAFPRRDAIDGRGLQQRQVDSQARTWLRPSSFAARNDVSTPRAKSSSRPDEVRLAARDLTGPGLSTLTFDVHSGEILGIAGVDGNGQIELVETLAGRRAVGSGSIALNGRDITRSTVTRV